MERLYDQNCAVEIRWDSNVKKSIRDYTTSGRRSAEVILGRSAIYFPIFDELLDQYGLPEDLTCLTVIESLLDPKVKSHVGAAGLWQFYAKNS